MGKSNKNRSRLVSAFLLGGALMLTHTAQAQIRMWKTGAPGGFNAVLHIQNQGGHIQQCALSWGNANGGFGGSTTIMVHPGRTEIVQTMVVAVNESHHCKVWEDPFKAQQARQEQERQRGEEAQRKAREQQQAAEQARRSNQQTMLQNQRQQNESAQQALQQEQQYHAAQQAEAMRQQQTMEADRLRQQEQSRHMAAQMELLDKQRRERENQARQLENARFFSDQNQQMLNSTHRKLGGYNTENSQLEEMVRSLEAQKR